jgi:hypothetical protein
MKILFNLLFIFVICVSNINAEKIMISDELRKFVNGDKIKYQILYQIPYKNSIWLEAVPEGSEKAATEGVKVSGVQGSELKFIELISTDGFVVSKRGLKKAAREQKKAHSKDKASKKSSC